ncbi:SURF1 family protein [Paenarthrobacter sp. Z7-10]|uniref:SURF1 family protein n=1 Tax=Paenarthrobacter sp. Z7-10 TaxID=2787635 RepID=UPI0022A9C346|nr:SURF1 family protein [Paenarthrobacter sp. Z7-10]MCZ2404344.1 SURF1 family protein [Paenarthrobacter sp. Z7-10]
MLKIALKPRWIAGLILALAVSGVFVLLSQWQFSRSTQNNDPQPVVTESVKPLLSTLKPGIPMHGSAADQLVTATGHFDPSKQVLVQGRLQDGKKGYWAVTAFVVDGAPVLKGAAASGVTVIPVARGWLADPSQAEPPPSGRLTLNGRLIPSEAPNPKPNVPEGQVAALSSAQLVNLWQLSSYPAFIISNQEVSLQNGPGGAAVGAQAVQGALKPITVTAGPQGGHFNWLNIFYAVEWVVFAGFAVFLWWRLVADEYRRGQEGEGYFDDAYDDDDGGDGGGGRDRSDGDSGGWGSSGDNHQASGDFAPANGGGHGAVRTTSEVIQ